MNRGEIGEWIAQIVPVESRLGEVRSAALSPLNLAHLRERVAELESRLDRQPARKRRKRSKT